MHLDLKAEAVPRFHRARPIPYALKTKVKATLTKLTEAKVFKRVRHSNWGAPIVVVPKENGEIRVGGNYKVTVNPFLIVDQHPLPLPEICATLEGGVLFKKLDLSKGL